MALVLLLLTPFVLWRMPTDIFPPINIPVVSAVWTYGGLSAQEIEQRILYVHERMISVVVVHDGYQPQQNIVRLNGVRGVLLTVLKSGAASTLEVVRGVKAAMPRVLSGLPPELQAQEFADQSLFVSTAIDGVLKEGVIAASLTALMILLFLGAWRSTLIIAISPDSRTLLTELEVDNARGEILAGSYGQVEFAEAKSASPLTLPGNALLFRAEGPQVGVVRADGKVELRGVKLGRDFGSTVEILGGVSPTNQAFSIRPIRWPAATGYARSPWPSQKPPNLEKPNEARPTTQPSLAALGHSDKSQSTKPSPSDSNP